MATSDELRGSARYADARSNVKDATGKVSDIVRALALSTLAVAWVWAGGLATADASPAEVIATMRGSVWLSAAVALSLVTMLLDLLQYVSLAWRWSAFAWSLDQLVLNRPTHLANWRFWAAWRLLWYFGVAPSAISHANEEGRGFGLDVHLSSKDNARRFRSLSEPDRSGFLDGYLVATRTSSIVRPSGTFFVLKVLAIAIAVVSLGAFGLLGPES